MCCIEIHVNSKFLHMEGFPLHPMLVHLPAGMAITAPVLTFVFYSIMKKHPDLKSFLWKILIIWQLVFTLAIYASMVTGEMDEEKYSNTLIEEKVEAHESSALILLILSIIAVVISVVSFKSVHLARIFFVIIQIVILGFTIYTAHKGGELVYSNRSALKQK